MWRSDLTGPRLAAVFLLGGVLLNYPILALFARPTGVAGVPLLVVWVYGVWLALIGVMAWVIERRP